MNEILSNLLYSITGGVIGLFLGWTLRSMQYAKEARDIVAKRLKDERGWYTHKISLGIVVGMTAGAAIWTGLVNVQFQKARHCTENTFSRVIETLNDRTASTTDVNIADSAQSQAFATLLTRLLDTKNPPTEAESRQLTQDYLDKLTTYNALKSARDSQTNFPTKEEYHNCLKGK